MFRHVLLFLLSAMPLLCPAKTLVNFADPLEAILQIRNGKIQLNSAGKRSIRFPSYGIFLPPFRRGEVILNLTTPEKPLSVTAVVHDRQGRIFRFPLKQTDRGYSTIIDSAATYPGVKKQKRETCVPEQPLRVMWLEFSGKTRTISLDTLDFSERGVMAQLKTGSDLSVLDLSGETIPELEAFNATSAPAQITLSFSVRNSANKEVDSGSARLSLAPGEKRSLPLKRPTLQDVYTVHYTIATPEGSFPFRKRFAALKPKEWKGVSRFPLGICTHFQRYGKEDVEKMIELLSLCGADEVRLSWLWPQINPAPGQWNFQRIDWLVKQFEKKNIAMLAMMGAAPKHAETTGYHRTNTKAALHLPQAERFEEWLRRFATRYDGKISRFCVWNEPDASHFADFDPTEYVKLQEIAHRTLKAVNPKNVVVAGGFANILAPYSQKALELTAKQAPDSIEMISAHLYMPLSRIDEVLADCRRFLRAQKLDLPLCTEETGEGTIDNRLQLITLFQKVIRSRVAGVKFFHWYNLRNCGFDSSDRQHNFGLVEHDLNPRPSFVTFHMLTSLYGNAELIRKEPWKNLYAVRFESPDAALYALWLAKPPQEQTLLLFKTDAETVELVDLFGNARRLRPDDGRYAVPVDSEGQTLRLTPANASLKVPQEMLTLQEPLRIIPGEAKEFRFLCRLPGDVVLKALPCDQLTISPTIRGEKGEFRIPVRAAQEFRPEEARVFRVQIFRDGKAFGEPIEFPISKIHYIPMGKMTKIGSITRQNQVRRMLPDTPEYGKLFWTDGRDCAVFFGAAVGKTDLHFQIGMNDDVHVQHFPAEEMWKGDSIQLVLQFPGQSDYWELGIAMTEDGKMLKHIWHAPKGMDVKKAFEGFQTRGYKQDKSHNFRLILTLSAFGTSPEALRKTGAYFNLLANDNDGELRESQLSFMGSDGTNPTERLTRGSPLLVVK